MGLTVKENMLLYSFVEAIEANDPYTGGHAKRVTKLSLILGSLLNIPEHRMNCLYAGALIHDIGKVGIPDDIINKTCKLNDDKFEIIKEHPVIGTNMLKNLSSFTPIIKIIKHHHERYNGKGYPEGLSGEELALESKIVSLADGLDAMLSDRPYRKGMSVDKVKEILKENKGTQWDPKLVDLALKNKLVKKGAGLNEKNDNINTKTNDDLIEIKTYFDQL